MTENLPFMEEALGELVAFPARPQVATPQRLPDRPFDAARRNLLEEFLKLIGSGASRAELTDEMVSTLRVMRSLRDLKGPGRDV